MKSIQSLDEFEKEVLESKSPVILDFYADWCGPCRLVGKVLEKMEEEGVKIIKINVDEAIEIATYLHISSLPTLMKFENGTLVAEHVGAMNETQIRAFCTFVQ